MWLQRRLFRKFLLCKIIKILKLSMSWRFNLMARFASSDSINVSLQTMHLSGRVQVVVWPMLKPGLAAREEQEQLSLQNRIERVEFIKANEKVNSRQVAKIKSDKSIANLIYILFFGSILGGVTALAAIAMAHVHRNSIGQQNWVQSHYAWQIRTFWLGSLWSALGLFLVVISFITASAKGLQNRSLNDALITFFNPFMLMGLAIIVISILWFWYRMIKGCVVLNRDEPVGGGLL